MATVLRTTLVGALVLHLACATGPAPKGPCATSTLVGTVTDLAGDPLSGAQVQQLELPSVGTVTSSGGTFAINKLRCGSSVTAVVDLLGYRRAIHTVMLSDDTVHVEAQLAVSQVAIPGGEFPTPGPRMILDAWRLLPTVLQSRAFLERLAQTASNGGVTVWVPWYSERMDTMVVAAGRTLRLRSGCSECAASPYRTVEGGARYHVAAGHVRIGAANLAGPRETLLFCVDSYRPGMEAALNCSTEAGTNAIVFERRSDGVWFRTR